MFAIKIFVGDVSHALGLVEDPRCAYLWIIHSEQPTLGLEVLHILDGLVLPVAEVGGFRAGWFVVLGSRIHVVELAAYAHVIEPKHI